MRLHPEVSIIIVAPILTAVTRAVSSTLGECELQYLERQEIDIAKAAAQHRDYEACLTDLGVRVVSLPADPQFPDGVFVEDPAIVVDELAVIARMGSERRRHEVDGVAEALSRFRPLKWIREPATLEGGDVLRVDKTLYAGISRRSNRHGIEQLAELLDPFGYRVIPVEVDGCLHLKSASCYLGDQTVLANRRFFEAGVFRDYRIIDVPTEEPSAPNVLRVRDTILIPSAFPKTRKLLEKSGFHVRPMDLSELLKAEAGVTCMSLIFTVP